MKIVISNDLLVTDIPEKLRQKLITALTIDNPKWLENVKMKRWNRGTPKKLAYYSKAGKDGLWLPRGYARQVLELCQKNGIKCDRDDRRRTLPDIEFSFSGRLKPFQQKAADQMLSKDFGVLNAPTGSGKTVIALYMLARRGQPSLIVVHTKNLATQWINRIEAFLGIPAEEIGVIGGGKVNIGAKVTVALVQTLYKCADEAAKQTGFLIVDECHRCPSRTFTDAVTEFDSKYMLGLSATPWRRDKLSKLIFWHLGDRHHTIDKTDLIKNRDILKAEVVNRDTNFQTALDPVNQYSKMLSNLTTDIERNILIATDISMEAKKENNVCLVLSDRKAHCENLRSILDIRFKIPSEILTGDLSDEERQGVLERLNKGQVKILIATGQLIGEGFDCSDLTTLFLATPIRFSGRVLQYLGRILRPGSNNKQPKVYDYIDKHIGVLKSAAEARQRIYVDD